MLVAVEFYSCRIREYTHMVMKKKTDIARSSAERDLTISTTKQTEAL